MLERCESESDGRHTDGDRTHQSLLGWLRGADTLVSRGLVLGQREEAVGAAEGPPAQHCHRHPLPAERRAARPRPRLSWNAERPELPGRPPLPF